MDIISHMSEVSQYLASIFMDKKVVEVLRKH